MWVVLVVMGALVLGAALFDWQARRRGNRHRADSAYWRAASEERRELRLRSSRRGSARPDAQFRDENGRA